MAEAVARRLVAAGQLVDVEPQQAFAHALVARRMASRIPAVREATGLAAYHAGQWQTAISELRAYHRMAGSQGHIAVLADCERALGRPERAIDLYRATDSGQLSESERLELLIVAAGARVDLKHPEAAVAMLQVRELAAAKTEPWLARLRYAYADALLAAGRSEEARQWFARAAEVDDEVSTDAAERLLELDGVVLEELEDEEEDLDEDDSRDEASPADESSIDDSPEEDSLSGDSSEEDSPEEDSLRGDSPEDGSLKGDSSEEDSAEEDSPEEDSLRGDSPEEDSLRDDSSEDGSPEGDLPNDDAPSAGESTDQDRSQDTTVPVTEDGDGSQRAT